MRITDRSVRARLDLYPGDLDDDPMQPSSLEEMRRRFPEGAPVIAHIFDDGSWVVGLRDEIGMGRTLESGGPDHPTGRAFQQFIDLLSKE